MPKLGGVSYVLISTPIFASQSHASSNSTLVIEKPAYVRLDVGRNYLARYGGAAMSSVPIASISGYVFYQDGSDVSPPPTLTTANVSLSGPLSHYLGILADGQFYVTNNITTANYDSLASSCSSYSDHPNQLICPMTLTVAGTTATWDFVVDNGVRALSPIEMVVKRLSDDPSQYEPTTTPIGPDYLEISAKPEDFVSSNPVSMVDLDNYFYIPSGTTVSYTFNATDLCTDASGKDICNGTAVSYPVVLLHRIDSYERLTALSSNTEAELYPNDSVITNADSEYCHLHSEFTISGSTLSGKNLCPGVYQINIKAQNTANSADADYTTFYVNVNQDNPSLSAWQSSPYSAATTNVIGADFQSNTLNRIYHTFSNMYMYVSSGRNPLYPTTMTYDFGQYEKDLNEANSTYHAHAYMVTPDFTDIYFTNEIYTPTNIADSNTWYGFWPVSSNADPAAAIESPWESYASTQAAKEQSAFGFDMLYVKYSQTDTSIDSTVVTDEYPQNLAVIKAANDLFKDSSTHAIHTMIGIANDYIQFDNQYYVFDPTQQQYFAHYLTDAAVSSDAAGIALDYEPAKTAYTAADLYKKIADTLAYQGKAFSYFAGSYAMKAPAVKALGPLGIFNISTYDLGTSRGVNGTAAPEGNLNYKTLGDTNFDKLQSAFVNDKICTTGSDYESVGACNEGYNQAALGNNSTWTNVLINSTTGEGPYPGPKNATSLFNFHYQLILPVARTASMFSGQEIWNPNVTGGVIIPDSTAAAPAMMMQDSVTVGGQSFTCHGTTASPDYNSEGLIQILDPMNEQAQTTQATCETLLCSNGTSGFIPCFTANQCVESQGTTLAYQAAQECYFESSDYTLDNANPQGTASIPVQKISSCGETSESIAIPFIACIRVDNLPGGVNNQSTANIYTGTIDSGGTTLPNQTDYLAGNTSASDVDNKASVGQYWWSILSAYGYYNGVSYTRTYPDTHLIGFGLFSLQSLANASNGFSVGTTRSSQSETIPTYIGWCDQYQTGDSVLVGMNCGDRSQSPSASQIYDPLYDPQVSFAIWDQFGTMMDLEGLSASPVGQGEQAEGAPYALPVFQTATFSRASNSLTVNWTISASAANAQESAPLDYFDIYATGLDEPVRVTATGAGSYSAELTGTTSPATINVVAFSHDANVGSTDEQPVADAILGESPTPTPSGSSSSSSGFIGIILAILAAIAAILGVVMMRKH